MDKETRLYRLRHAIKVMERVEADPAHKFNLGTWYSSFVTTEQRAVECGTACCFAGWLSLDPIAQSQGFKPSLKHGLPGFEPELTHGSHATKDYLGITLQEAIDLVSPREYSCPSPEIKPGDVIFKLQRLVKYYEQV